MAEKEYIERETLKILFAGACAECRDSCAEFDGIEADCNQCLLNGVIKDAKSIPAADVQPVVLCRDCIHLNKNESNMNGFYRCDRYDAWQDASNRVHMPIDGFCSYGDRGTNNEEAEKALEGMTNG